ncbi:MAG: lspA [Pseudonocardiales bacterium]|nr:lspA [Pseudonocardiales bacterium]
MSRSTTEVITSAGVRDNDSVSSADRETDRDAARETARETARDTDRDTAPPSGATVPEISEPNYPRRVRLFAAVALVAVGLDVLSKLLVAANLGHGQQIRILGGAIYLVETRNSGAAFSLGTGATAVLTVIALAVVGFILRTAGRMRSTGWAVALGLVLGGALGNLVDRIFRAPGVGRGNVVDWISLFSNDGHVWPIFNLADASIVCGAVLSAVLALRGIDIDGRGGRTKRGGPPE